MGDIDNLKPVSMEESFIHEISAESRATGAKLAYSDIYNFISERQKFLVPPMRFLLGASKEVLASKNLDTIARNALQATTEITLRKPANPQLIVPMETIGPEYLLLVPAENNDPLPVLDNLFPVMDMDDANSALFLGRRGIMCGPQTEHMRLVHMILLGTLTKLIENDSVISAVRPLKEVGYLLGDEQIVHRLN